MTQQERINLLCVEQRELGDLLSGMQACDSIPPVFIAMARTKALRIAEELMKLEAESTNSQNLQKAPSIPSIPSTPSTQISQISQSTQSSQSSQSTQSSQSAQSTQSTQSTPIPPITPKAPTPQPAPIKEPEVTSSRGDIRSLLTMGDKFLFQRELFRGDIGMLNYTLDRLNKLEGMREAEAFVRSEFRWADDAPGVKEFYELLERYYLNTII